MLLQLCANAVCSKKQKPQKKSKIKKIRKYEIENTMGEWVGERKTENGQ